MSIVYQLRRAAEQELVKALVSHRISEREGLVGAAEAFEALATLLGDDDWFFGTAQPAWLDVAVFAYTYLILDEALAWRENKLAEELKRHDNLMAHCKRVYEKCYHPHSALP